MDVETRPAPEEQSDKPKIDVLEVLVKKCAGTVKWYSHKLLYGFISRTDNQEDVFVHRTAISESNSRTPNLRNGEEVEFSVVRTTNGIEAYNVTGPEGASVQGFNLLRRRRRPQRDRPDATGDGNNTGDADADAEEGDQPKKTERAPRRRPRRGRGGGPVNGEPNGTHSEGDVYYEAGDNDEAGDSPSAGETRHIKREDGGFNYGRRGRGVGGGGFRGRGAPRPYSSRGGRGGVPRGGPKRGAAVETEAA